jgi:hypothetical protein
MNEIKTSGGWYYTIEDNTVTVHGRDNDGLELVIPPFIDGLPVRRIGDCAFKEQKITVLSLPSGITSIGSRAFFDHHIRDLVIPDTVTSIEQSAFGHICFDLFKSVTIGANVELVLWAIDEEFVDYYKMYNRQAGTYVRKGSWYRTKGNVPWDYHIVDGSAVITGYHGKESDVTIPAKIDGLPVSAVRGPGEGRSIFEYVEQEIKTLVISEGIKKITDSAFVGKSVDKYGITKVVIPPGVTIIGNGVFQYNLLASVYIPPGVTFIGDWAFHHNQLTSIIVPESVTEMGMYAFGANLITDITIGANVKMKPAPAISPEDFRLAYEDNGSQAGRYRYVNRQWRFTPAPEAEPDTSVETGKGKTIPHSEQEETDKKRFSNIAAAVLSIPITALGVIVAPIYSAFMLGRVVKEAATRHKKSKINKPYTPEPSPPPPPSAFGTDHVAVVKNGNIEIFGMSFPLINESYKRPQYYFSGELKRFDIKPVIIHYMGWDIPVCSFMYLHKDGSFHGSCVYREYRLGHQGIVYSMCGGFRFYPNGNPQSFTVDEYVETNFTVDGKKLALYKYDTLDLYETSGRPKTLRRGHEGPGNWLEIDEYGNVTDSFNEKRGFGQ